MPSPWLWLWVIRVEPTLNAAVIGGSGFPVPARGAKARAMRSLATLLFVAVAVWAGVPGWTGDERLALPAPQPLFRAERVALDPADPARRKVGALTFLGGVRLTSPDAAFGGFSALAVRDDRFTLLSDGGNVATFRMDARGRVSEPGYRTLPSGPATGWRKMDRDSESLAVDPAGGALWVGFERANAIWRYAPGFARVERSVRPPEMKRWRANGGPESMVRLADGRFLVIAEEATHGPGREALLFASDPTKGGQPLRFRYLPPAGFDPSDATQLPDGRVLVLNRWWGLPIRFRSALVVFDPARIRPGALVRGREIARLAPPLRTENYEGVATTVEGGRTMLWLVSDDDTGLWQHTLLLKFRMD